MGETSAGMVVDDTAPEVGDWPLTKTVEPISDAKVVDKTLIVEDEDLGPG